MKPLRFVARLVLAAALTALCAGCAGFPLQPNRITVYADRTESETAGDRKGRTVANKVGVSATYDLPR